VTADPEKKKNKNDVAACHREIRKDSAIEVSISSTTKTNDPGAVREHSADDEHEADKAKRADFSKDLAEEIVGLVKVTIQVDLPIGAEVAYANPQGRIGLEQL
jgi:hypothetical protein